MIINIGSENKVKIDAVREGLESFGFFSDALFRHFSCESLVSDQPKSMEETIRGAINRAKSCFSECRLSIGLEDGLMQVPYTKTGYMNIGACAIFDGKEFHLGLSPAFEYPQKATSLVISKNLDINQAFYRLGITKSDKIGSECGAIGLLSKGIVTRKCHLKAAVAMAAIHLENSEMFK